MSSETIFRRSYGEVKKPETINWAKIFGRSSDVKILDDKLIAQNVSRDPSLNASALNIEGGLFCSKIFGSINDLECYCGKYKGIKHKGTICNTCLVEVAYSEVSKERFGHINLAAPVVHPWFKDIGSVLLDIPIDDFERILYFESYIVIDGGDTHLAPKQLIGYDELRKISVDYGGRFKVDAGVRAIKRLLNRVDLNARYKELSERMQNESNREMVRSIKKGIYFFDVLKGTSESIMLHIIPVLPSGLRPPVEVEEAKFTTFDLNGLYRRVINRNNRLKRLIQLKAPQVILKNEKRMIQEAVDALFGNQRTRHPLIIDILRGELTHLKEKLANPDLSVKSLNYGLLCSAIDSKLNEDNQSLYQGKEIQISLFDFQKEISINDLAKKISCIMLSLCFDARINIANHYIDSRIKAIEDFMALFVPDAPQRDDVQSYCRSWNDKASNLYDEKQYEVAIKCCDQIINVDQVNKEALFRKATCLLVLGRYLEAINFYDKTIQLDRQEGGAWSNKGIAYRKLGCDNEALKCYEAALEIESEDVRAWLEKGNILGDAGRAEKAIPCYDKVLSLEPENLDALINKGIALDRLGRYEKAVKCYDQALDINPGNAYLWYNKGLSFEGKRNNIISQRQNKTHEEILLAEIFGECPSLKDILKCYDKAIEINPQLTEAFFRKGITLCILKRTILATDCFEQALIISPSSFNIWYSLAIAQDKLGWKSKAKMSFKKFLGLAPDNLGMQGKIAYTIQRLKELGEEGSQLYDIHSK